MGLSALKVRLAPIAIVTGFGVATAVAGAAPGSLTVVSTQSSALGTILVSSTGRSLYHDASEKKNVIVCVGSCAKVWSPLLVAAGAKATAAPGARASLLGTIKRPDGKLQVTYHGMPLYLFSGDKKAGDVKGQGAGAIWHVIAPSGLVITATAKTSTATTTPTSSGTGSSSGTSSSSGTGSSSGTRSGAGSSSGSGTSTGTGSGVPSDCTTNPGGYGCM